MEDLITLINSNPDPRVLKRALAVKMSLQTYSVAQIATILQVSQPFVSKWKSVYLQQGSEGLGLGYEGAKPYLSADNKLKVLSWLKEKNHWNVSELEDYLFKEFGVEYASKHSYYCLFHEAGLTFKKAQRTHPKKDLEAVEQKKDLQELAKQWAIEVEKANTVVLLGDECHLRRDAKGYVWGPSNKRIAVEMRNENERQTYYGALDIISDKVVLKEFKKGNNKSTTEFIKHLLNEYKGKKIKLIWDGAGYHRSEEFQVYLSELNKDLERKDWKVECIRLATYAPEENAIEYIWQKAKNSLRYLWHKCKSFKNVKLIFELSCK